MKSVLLYSGGLDSTVLLYDLIDSGDEVLPIGIDYGQRHAKELEAAFDICQKLKLQSTQLDLGDLRLVMKGSSQTDDSVDVPLGHYADPSMKVTVVPNRNMIMLSIACALAVSEKADRICFAAHAGDHPIYPDCRPAFIHRLGEAMLISSYNPVRLDAPYQLWNKADIVKQGSKLGVPFEKTWSCYIGEDKHCGECGTCVERKEAFLRAGVPDPTEYEE